MSLGNFELVQIARKAECELRTDSGVILAIGVSPEMMQSRLRGKNAETLVF